MFPCSKSSTINPTLSSETSTHTLAASVTLFAAPMLRAYAEGKSISLSGGAGLVAFILFFIHSLFIQMKKYVGIILASICTSMANFNFWHFALSVQSCGEKQHRSPTYPISSHDVPRPSAYTEELGRSIAKQSIFSTETIPRCRSITEEHTQQSQKLCTQLTRY